MLTVILPLLAAGRTPTDALFAIASDETLSSNTFSDDDARYLLQQVSSNGNLAGQTQALSQVLPQLAARGHLPFVKLIVETFMADPNTLNQNEQTVLFNAASNNRLPIVRYLLEQFNGVVNPNKADNLGITPLNVAAQNGHVDIVRYVLANRNRYNINIEEPDNNCMRPIDHAINNGHVEVVKAFVEDAGFDLRWSQDATGAFPIQISVANNNLDLFKHVLGVCGVTYAKMITDMPSQSTFADCSEEGNFATVAGASSGHGGRTNAKLAGRQLIHIAAMSDAHTVLQYLVETMGISPCLVCPPCGNSDSGKSPLDLAVCFDCPAAVRYLMRATNRDARPRRQDDSLVNGEGTPYPNPYASALMFGSLETVKVFIEEFGCEPREPVPVSITPSGFEAAPTQRIFPIHMACMRNAVDLVRYLVEQHRCDPLSAMPDGYQTIHFAAEYNAIGVLKYLVEELRVSPSTATSNGDQPLYFAAYDGRGEAMRYLVEEVKVNPLATNSVGDGAIDVAQKRNHSSAVEYLKSVGCVVKTTPAPAKTFAFNFKF